eukprot:gene4910-3522_t
MRTTSADVASSYDVIAKAHEGDVSSGKTPFRSFNNFVKNKLIQESLNIVRRGDAKHSAAAVLDLASGRGGDIGKWFFVKSSGYPPLQVSKYHCFDISPESIKEAEKRYAVFPSPKAEATFEVADCYSDEFLQTRLPSLPLFQQYSVVSVQFALHYACGSEERIEKVIRAIAAALRPGGVFIASTVNEEKLAEYVQERPKHAMFSIEMIEPFEWVTPFKTKKPMLKVGSQYHFQLEGFVDSPEYVVPVLMIKKHAAAAGLVECPEASKPFDAYLEEYANGWKSSRLELTSEELDLIQLYRTLCFVKGEPKPQKGGFNAKGSTAYPNTSGNHQKHRPFAQKKKNAFGGKAGGFNSANFLSRDMWGTAASD